MPHDRHDGLHVVSANPPYPEFTMEEDTQVGAKAYVHMKLERLA